MSRGRSKDSGPPRTRTLPVGQELPQANVASLYTGGESLPDHLTARLHFETGPRAGGVFTLTEPVTVLGRGADYADVEIDDDSASRRHAFIAYKDDTFLLADMGSTNGTMLNGKLVGETPLKTGDRIQIGGAVLRFEVDGRR